MSPRKEDYFGRLPNSNSLSYYRARRPELLSGDEVTSLLFRTAVPGILPVTRLPFAGLCRGWCGACHPTVIPCNVDVLQVVRAEHQNQSYAEASQII